MISHHQKKIASHYTCKDLSSYITHKFTLNNYGNMEKLAIAKINTRMKLRTCVYRKLINNDSTPTHETPFETCVLLGD